MKGSLYIIGFFIVGILCGLNNWLPLESHCSDISFYALCALMFSVGISIGNNPETIRNFKALNPGLALLPLATILGTWGGCLAISLLLHYSTADFPAF